MKVVIEYGTEFSRIDISEICIKQLRFQDLICIPADDTVRAKIFSDPQPNVVKSIFVSWDKESYVFGPLEKCWIDLKTAQMSAGIPVAPLVRELVSIHKGLCINQGSLDEELPEQKMSVQFLQGHEKVLEIGGNIGRNSCVIATILQEKQESVTKSMLVLESDPVSFQKLKENRDANGFDFQIENRALSNRSLVQQGWVTFESETVPEGHHKVQTLTEQELYEKYPIPFDTLVLDCEGAFQTILQDMPNLLDKITKIIMENDYFDRAHQEYIQDRLLAKGFQNVQSEKGPWGPCASNFYEVWTR